MGFSPLSAYQPDEVNGLVRLGAHVRPFFDVGNFTTGPTPGG